MTVIEQIKSREAEIPGGKLAIKYTDLILLIESEKRIAITDFIDWFMNSGEILSEKNKKSIIKKFIISTSETIKQ